MADRHIIIYSSAPDSPLDIIPFPSSYPHCPKHDKYVYVEDAPKTLYDMWDRIWPWPEAQKYLAKNRTAALSYVLRCIGRRWAEAEPAILEDPETAYIYASTIIEARWPKAEPIILTDPYYTYMYAAQLIKTRWPEAEPIIRNNVQIKHHYEQYFKCKL